MLPIDDEFDGDVTAAGGDALRTRLQAAAREAGVFAPHAPTEFGGLGLNMVDRAGVFEEAGYSLFGPMALHIAAPDEGNVHLLAHVASEAQTRTFPRSAGTRRGAVGVRDDRACTGAGADPSALATLATKVDGGWLVNGRKWFITGADGAAFFIIMARTSGKPGEAGGATMLLADAGTEGLEVGRHLETVDKSMIGGHCVVDVHRRIRIRRWRARAGSTRDSAMHRSGSAPPA